MKLLLHVCCAPCFIFPLRKLLAQGYEVNGFFYNPNIHPLAEYEKRKIAVEDSSRALSLDILWGAYDPKEFFRAINEHEAAPERCALCWRLRLQKTAQEALLHGCAYFTTTLLVSPYQDHEMLKKIGAEVGEGEGVKFYYEDFRPGFRAAHQEARDRGIYCQNYCGCLYSQIERSEAAHKKK
jgi:epoxyqueuosine reductase